MVLCVFSIYYLVKIKIMAKQYYLQFLTKVEKNIKESLKYVMNKIWDFGFKLVKNIIHHWLVTNFQNSNFFFLLPFLLRHCTTMSSSYFSSTVRLRSPSLMFLSAIAYRMYVCFPSQSWSSTSSLSRNSSCNAFLGHL